MRDLVQLQDCPVGLFLTTGGELCVKTEYGDNDGAYLVSSGEFSRGSAPQTIDIHRGELVRPISDDELSTFVRGLQG